jgi:hypothetical protein
MSERKSEKPNNIERYKPVTRAGKVLAARKLQSGDILVTADSEETKNLMEQEDG